MWTLTSKQAQSRSMVPQFCVEYPVEKRTSSGFFINAMGKLQASPPFIFRQVARKIRVESGNRRPQLTYYKELHIMMLKNPYYIGEKGLSKLVVSLYKNAMRRFVVAE